MTRSICADSAVGDEKILKDTRDDNTYAVRKMKDGKCWMAQNLRLGGTSAMTLTPADSNVTSNYTLPASTNSFSTSASNNTAQINTTHNNIWINGTTVNTSGIPTNQTQYVGVYYNWQAATAGSGTSSTGSYERVTQSVCPKGWRLPNGGAIDTIAVNGEFQQLYDAYGSASTFIRGTSATLSGYWYGSSVSNQGSVGSWWSRIAYSTTYGYALHFDSSSVNPQYGNYKFNGFSVRCVAE